MKRFCLLGVLVMVFLLSACGCKHDWKAADCINAKTCTLCGATEGEPLTHQWKDATCTAPKTCERCRKTEGTPKGHAFPDGRVLDCENPTKCTECGTLEMEAKPHAWVDATCAAPKTCAVCHKTEGEPLPDHDWQEATTEVPKTCRVCGATEGEKINTDARFRTELCEFLFGSWKSKVVETVPVGDQTYTLEYWAYYEFHNDGTVILTMEVEDREAFIVSYSQLMEAVTYAGFAEMGVSKADADRVLEAEYGMSVQQYCRQSAEAFLDTYTKPLEMVYYVKDRKLYMGSSWKEVFDSVQFKKTETDILLGDGTTLVPMD